MVPKKVQTQYQKQYQQNDNKRQIVQKNDETNPKSTQNGTKM